MPLLDLVLLSGPSTFDIIERTASTARVQHVVQLSMAPAFLLAGIGAAMNVMTNRLIWVANRIETIRQYDEEGRAGSAVEDLPALEKRRGYAQAAVMFSTAAALTISVVIVELFVSAFVITAMGTLVALSWIITMGLLFTGLTFFLLETRTAALRNRERMRQAKERAALHELEETADRL